MLQETTVAAAAVGCAAVAIVTATVAILLWMRTRQRRLRRLTRASRLGRRYSVHGDTVTELSKDEGSALRRYGQLPFGSPTEWGYLASRESLPVLPAPRPASSPASDASFSLRRSLSRSRSMFVRHTAEAAPPPPPSGPIHLRTMSNPAAAEVLNQPQQASLPPKADEPFPLSAVEGIMELPAERTPRQTPERDVEQCCEVGPPPLPLPRPSAVAAAARRVSKPWMLASPKDATELSTATRVRAGSITTQTAGAVPDIPVPPPPAVVAGVGVVPSNRLYLPARNNSLARLSSMSLATADSSILDDAGRHAAGPDAAAARAAAAMVTAPGLAAVTSPSLPPCPTFAPFNANEVGLTDSSRKKLAAIRESLQSTAPYARTSRLESRPTSEMRDVSPRRSLTTHCDHHHVNTGRMRRGGSGSGSGGGGGGAVQVRRSESVSTESPARESFGSNSSHWAVQSAGGGGVYLPPLSPVSLLHWSLTSPGNSICLPPPPSQSSDDHDMLRWQSESESGSTVHPYLTSAAFRYSGGGGSSNGSADTAATESALTRQAAGCTEEGAAAAWSPLRASAMKSNSRRRKGHKRQNCVRISIHPPTSFAGPIFSPTFEESEPELQSEMASELASEPKLGLDERRRTARAATTGPLSCSASMSNAAATRHSMPVKYTGTRHGLADSLGGSRANTSSSAAAPATHRSKLKSKKHAGSDELAAKVLALPYLNTSLPSVSAAAAAAETSLSSTPSSAAALPWPPTATAAASEIDVDIAELPAIAAAQQPQQENVRAVPHTYAQQQTSPARRSMIKGPRSQPAKASSSPRYARPKSAYYQSSSNRDNSSSSRDNNSNSNSSSSSSSRIPATTSSPLLASRSPPCAIPRSPGRCLAKARTNTSASTVAIWEDDADCSSPVTAPHGSATASSSRRRQLQQLDTPRTERFGLGIGPLATPGSLYDRDGFLKE